VKVVTLKTFGYYNNYLYVLVGWATYFSNSLWVGDDVIIDWREIIEVIMLELRAVHFVIIYN